MNREQTPAKKIPFRNRPIILDENVIARFRSKVKSDDTSDGCWEWAGGVYKDGYGVFTINRSPFIAHRVAWVIEHGMQVPDDKPFICHKCDNKKCCRPSHLFAGTPLDNNRDCNEKGRRNHQRGENHFARRFPELAHWKGDDNPAIKTPEIIRRGEKHWKAKLTAEMVLEIRHRAALGEASQMIAQDYGVTPRAIRLVVARKNWKHI